jgi:hypothetical protein
MARRVRLRSVAAMSSNGPVSPAAAAQAVLAPIRPEGYFGGVRLLAADARVAYLLANDARCRAMERLFGIPRDEKSGLATLIALGTLAEVIRRSSQGLAKGPTAPDYLFGLGMLRESAYGLAGPSSRQSHYFGTLVAIALVGASARVAVRKTVHGVRGVSHQAYTDFHHRYGHLIRPNRPAAR